MKRTPNKNRIKRDYLAGMTPQELAKKYKLKASQVQNMARRGKWSPERKLITSKVAQLVVQSEVDAIMALKEMERRDMNQLLHYARNMVDPNKPSAFKIKASADVMKIAFERLYKSYGIAEKVESKETVENVIKIEWPEQS